jgi:hypothetical protein
MKKIAWCVPLSFVIAVIFLLGNAASAQAATICGWTAISVGTNEYVYTWSCYDNGGDEGREDIKYGTRPGSNNPRDGGGGGGTSATEKPTTEEGFKKLWKLTKDLCKKSTESCAEWGVRIELNYCALRAGSLVSICNLAVHSEQEGLNSRKNVECP